MKRLQSRIKLKVKPLGVSIAVQKKIFGLWISFDGYNVAMFNPLISNPKVKDLVDNLCRVYKVNRNNIIEA